MTQHRQPGARGERTPCVSACGAVWTCERVRARARGTSGAVLTAQAPGGASRWKTALDPPLLTCRYVCYMASPATLEVSPGRGTVCPSVSAAWPTSSSLSSRYRVRPLRGVGKDSEISACLSVVQRERESLEKDCRVLDDLCARGCATLLLRS